MSDLMRVLPFEELLNWILIEYKTSQSIFGIPASQFYHPKKSDVYATPNLFGHELSTPIGPAAGPHTQLAQNIVSAWLTGGRFIELKTVQIMDELEIPRPCIDMEDEGYNVEWSQELKLKQSVEEYVKAWVLIHILHDFLGFDRLAGVGTIFNMSVGYNLEGIKSPVMTEFMDKLVDATESIAAIRRILEEKFPQFVTVEVPNAITNSVTLSTMHGCPPDEIERIAKYMLEERGLHTTIKLNPTLLGKEKVLKILHQDLGFAQIEIPDTVFEHDLRYEVALNLIKTLQQTAHQHGLVFGVKLSNTLAMTNHKSVMPGSEMYMSGRALYPLTVNLFNQLMHDLDGKLNVSYSAGADALNVATLLSCGALPVTVASDLLKPGGYGRFGQYLINTEKAMLEPGAKNLAEFSKDKLKNLEAAAADALSNPRYKKGYRESGMPKVPSGLGLFDCVVAPCVEACPVKQDVPEYAHLIAEGKYDEALGVILSRNPLPGVTGYVCTHICQEKCTRTATNYEEAIGIRLLKRIAFEKGKVEIKARAKNGHKAAVIGAGPAGLSAAYFLALNGVAVTIFEAKDVIGGMMQLIPSYRLPEAVINEDVARITDLGVEIKTGYTIRQAPENLLKEGYDAVFIGSGFQKDAPLDIDGIHSEGVYAALDLLEQVRQGKKVNLGHKALVIGGGDTAMDAAGVSRRLTGQPSTIVYRRTLAEMPASPEEREAVFVEGTQLLELASPTRVISENGHVVALECIKNQLGEPGPDGRRRPVAIEGSEFQIPTDSIIVAIGQEPDLYFMQDSRVMRTKKGAIVAAAIDGQAGVEGVYAGGDAVINPDSIISACADGEQAAEAICRQMGITYDTLPFKPLGINEEQISVNKNARVIKQSMMRPDMLPLAARGGFDLLEKTYSEAQAQQEAARCLQCASYCDKCVEVCPNRANLTYFVPASHFDLPVVACRDHQAVVLRQETLKVSQTRQIVHIDDLCNECGDCDTFCVHEGKPYREKPRLFFDEGVYRQEQNNAYFVEKMELDWSIRCRTNGVERELILNGNGDLKYESPWVKASLILPELKVDHLEIKATFEGEQSLLELGEMYVLLNGLITSMPYLPYRVA